MPTALLILPTGTYRAEEYLFAAARLGVTIVTGSERPQAMASQMGERFVVVPLEDPDRAAAAIVAHARRVPLDAVISIDDQGLLVAALACEALGLAHSPPAAVRITRDKAAMRQAFARAGVPQPEFRIVEGGARDDVAEAALAIGCPVVVKPCSLSGSRGVIRADSPDQARRAATRIASILEEAGESPAAPLLVEAFVPGPEVAVDGILSGGDLEVIAIFDKPDPLDGPYFEETLYVAPSRLDQSTCRSIERTTAAAVHAIGLSDGPVHAELRVPAQARSSGTAGPSSRAGPCMLEIAGRTIGGRCSRALALPGGATLEELVVARALGLPAPQARLAGPAGVLMIPIPRSGTLRAVHNVDQARSLDHITGVEIAVPLGREVKALPEGDRYLGFVFASGPDAAVVEAALRQALDLIEVEISTDDIGHPARLVR
ncbi:MAG: ATP-grasp domain-containing protein [Acidimicrobiales bacterium]